MERIKETVATLLVAARYSLAFCWRNAKKETLVRLVILFVSAIASYLSIYVMGDIFNAVQATYRSSSGKALTFDDVVHSAVVGPILVLASIMLLGVIVGKLSWYFRSRGAQRLSFAAQREVDQHRASLDVARFESKAYDDLSKQIEELPNGWQTRTEFANQLFGLLSLFASFITFGASLLWHKPIYALVLLVTGLPMIFVEFKLTSAWWSLRQGLVPHHKKRGVLQRPYRGITTFLQASMFGQMPTLRREIDINIGGVIEAYDKIRRKTLLQEMLTRFLAIGGLCLVIVHAVWSTLSGAGEIGTLTIIIAAARTFQGNLEEIVSLMAEQWNSAKGVILIERDFLSMKPLLKTEYPVTPDFSRVPEIRFEKVNFAYPNSPDGKLVLRDVSFSIKPGSRVALVGKSGSGKSTLQKLLMRNYDPTSGDVFAGGINLRNIEPHVWCKVISALTQEYTVLERTVGHEIASSRLDQPISADCLANSVQFACFDDVVSSDSKGYDSQIGTEFGGREFSGGERQRLALARVHYRNTPILILDEPDSKLDPESAQRVIDNVFALKDVTVILITHHVSRAERCDHIIAMEKYEIAEQGTHEELMARDGVYATLYRKDRERIG